MVRPRVTQCWQWQSLYRGTILGIAWVVVVLHLSAAEVPQGSNRIEGFEWTSIEVRPAQIEMQRPSDTVQLLVTGRLASGEQVDLTRNGKIVNPPQFVRISETGRCEPTADGSEVIRMEVAGQTLEVPVHVSGLNDRSPISFVQHVAPNLSKMGCNAGTCHGSKEGQRGFKLSLRGYDFSYDYLALTDDIAARRFNRVEPDQSLMLLKASGSVPHVGGALTQPGERRYELLRRWIEQGTQLDLDAPRVVSIQLYPENPIIPREQMTQQLTVMATYQDGSVRDVTADAFVESGNIEIVSADKQGIITTLQRGEAPVLARFEGAYTATTITVMGDRSGFTWQQPETHNFIDELVYQKLARVRVLPSDLCTDEEFVRRVYLDLVGLPPTVDQIRQFIAQPEGRAKRDALIDELLGSPAYVEHWTNKWADMLQVNRKFLGDLGAAALRDWIQQAVATNMPYDKFAYEIITARGSTLDHPAAAYWKVLREPSLAMENTTHLFLAVRFNCNKCHDHPFERWTQDQYYHLTAFFAQVGRKEDPTFRGQRIGGSAVENAVPLVEVIYDTGQGETTHDRTGQVSPPAFPYPSQHPAEQTASRREELARWITSPDNRYFASSYVNRLWGYLLGVGLIEPIDDIRAGNPPSNPELLRRLTDEFVKSGFDVRHVLRTICQSRVYQHSVATNRWNSDDAINYSHALPRRLPAEVLFDTIHMATGSQPHIPGVPSGFRAAQLPDATTSLPFLDDFGRPPRESACECERSSGIVLGPIMKLINGPTVNDAIVDQNNAIKQLVDHQADNGKVVEEIFLRFLGRLPTAHELELGAKSLDAPRQEAEAARAAVAGLEKERLAKQREWEAQLAAPVAWTPAIVTQADSAAGAQLGRNPDGIIQVDGTRAQDTYTLTIPEHDLSANSQWHGLRLEALSSDSLPNGGPGRSDSGNFVVNELEVSYRLADGTEKRLAINASRASFSQDGWSVSGAHDGNPDSGWAIFPQARQNHVADFEFAEPLARCEGGALVVRIVHKFADGAHTLGRFRLALTGSSQPISNPRPPESIWELVRKPEAERTPEQRAQLAEYHLGLDPAVVAARQSLQVVQQQAAESRLTGAQDIAWALINTPAFLFNR